MAAAARASRSLTLIRARTEAADCLLQILQRHRTAACKPYREPHRQAVERLGRLVFGREFVIVLDDDLRNLERHLNGVALAVDQLS